VRWPFGGGGPDDLPPVDPQGRPVEDAARPPGGLVSSILGGTERVEDLLARAAVAAHGRAAAEHAAAVRARGELPSAAARDVVAVHTRMARAQGAAAAAAITAVEAGSFWGTAGTLTLPAAITGVAADLTSLAWVQARMVMHLAALHGHDPFDGPARMADLLELWGITDVRGVVEGGRSVVARSALRRVASPRARLRTLLRMVGLRSLTRRVVPVLNVPMTARANAETTERLGEAAILRFSAPPRGRMRH
jgi:hypothetical protein